MIADEDIIQVLKSMHACCSKREVTAVRAVLAYALVKQQELTAAHAACPCLHTTPCDPRCTCLNPYSSHGCARCCSYGSKEQQRATAEQLARLRPASGDEHTCEQFNEVCAERDALERDLTALRADLKLMATDLHNAGKVSEDLSQKLADKDADLEAMTKSNEDWFKEAKKAHAEAARKDEALRACVEALEEILQAAQEDDEDANLAARVKARLPQIRAALAHPGVSEK